MSQKKNTKSKVPATKVEGPKTVKLTKSQKDLFTTKRATFNESLESIGAEFNKLTGEILGKMIDTFIEELKIDVVKENWRFNANALQFDKVEGEIKNG